MFDKRARSPVLQTDPFPTLTLKSFAEGEKVWSTNFPVWSLSALQPYKSNHYLVNNSFSLSSFSHCFCSPFLLWFGEIRFNFIWVFTFFHIALLVLNWVFCFLKKKKTRVLCWCLKNRNTLYHQFDWSGVLFSGLHCLSFAGKSQLFLFTMNEWLTLVQLMWFLFGQSCNLSELWWYSGPNYQALFTYSLYFNCFLSLIVVNVWCLMFHSKY